MLFGLLIVSAILLWTAHYVITWWDSRKKEKLSNKIKTTAQVDGQRVVDCRVTEQKNYYAINKEIEKCLKKQGELIAEIHELVRSLLDNGVDVPWCLRHGFDDFALLIHLDGGTPELLFAPKDFVILSTQEFLAKEEPGREKSRQWRIRSEIREMRKYYTRTLAAAIETVKYFYKKCKDDPVFFVVSEYEYYYKIPEKWDLRIKLDERGHDCSCIKLNSPPSWESYADRSECSHQRLLKKAACSNAFYQGSGGKPRDAKDTGRSVGVYCVPVRSDDGIELVTVIIVYQAATEGTTRKKATPEVTYYMCEKCCRVWETPCEHASVVILEAVWKRLELPGKRKTKCFG